MVPPALDPCVKPALQRGLEQEQQAGSDDQHRHDGLKGPLATQKQRSDAEGAADQSHRSQPHHPLSLPRELPPIPAHDPHIPGHLSDGIGDVGAERPEPDGKQCGKGDERTASRSSIDRPGNEPNPEQHRDLIQIHGGSV